MTAVVCNINYNYPFKISSLYNLHACL